MRSVLLNIILFLSFCCIVFIYYQKDKRQENYIEHFSRSLSGLKEILPQGTRFNYKGIHSDPVNEWETFLFPRYTLIPNVMGLSFPTDSALVIVRLDADTTERFIDSTSTIIWEHKDTTYHYYFIK